MNADIDILYHNEIILSIYFQPLNFYLDIKRRHDKVVRNAKACLPCQNHPLALSLHIINHQKIIVDYAKVLVVCTFPASVKGNVTVNFLTVLVSNVPVIPFCYFCRLLITLKSCANTLDPDQDLHDLTRLTI